MSDNDSVQTVDSVDDFSKASPDDLKGLAAHWCNELAASRRGPYKRWSKRVKDITKRYRDEDIYGADSDDIGLRRNARFNILWSNIQTLGPSIYARPPQAIAERRYLDRDVIGRAASVVLQRSLEFQIDEGKFDHAMKQARTDYLIGAWGDAWQFYEPTMKPAEMMDGQQDAVADDEGGALGVLTENQPSEDLEWESVSVEYVHWSDQLVTACRFWSEVTWRAKRAFLTKKRLAKLCGDAIAKNVPLGGAKDSRDRVGQEIAQTRNKAEVWQIWDFENLQIVYICEAYKDGPLKVVKDPLKLKSFWPAVRPLLGTTTNDSIWPIPDYTIYRDQAAELDNLTARIAALVRAIKAVGVCDGSIPELQRLLKEGHENTLIPVKNWAKLSQKGGLDGSISMIPMKDLADTLMRLYEARSQVKADLYEVTGISDILRGNTNPNETASAQNLKGQYADVRLRDRRDEFNRFVLDHLKLMAEIISQHFSERTLYEMSGFKQWWEDQSPAKPEPMQQPMPGVEAMGGNGGPAGPLPGETPPPMMGAPQAMNGTPPAPDASGAMGAAPMGLPPTAQPQPANQPPLPGGAAYGPGQAAAPFPMQAPAPIFSGPEAWKNGIDPECLQVFTDAVKLLRSDKLRGFRINIETDSTIQPNQQEEKAGRVEFIGAVTQFLASAGDMAERFPSLMPVLGKILLFGARGFHVGRDLESSLEAMVAQMEVRARNPAPKPPSPEEVKAKGEMAKQQGDAEARKQDMMIKQAEAGLEQQMMQAKHALEMQKMQAEIQMMQMELQIEREKLELQRQELEMKQQSMLMDAQLKERGQQLEAEGMEIKAAHEERSFERAETHESNKMELAEEAAANKARTAAKPAKAA